MKSKLGILALVLISLLILTGCKTDQPKDGSITTSESSAGYPAPEVTIPQITPPVVTPFGYPAPGSDTSPSTGPVRENASAMNVVVLSIIPNDKNAEEMILHVKVNSAVPANNLEQYNPNLIGQELDVHVSRADAANLAVGNVLNLTVSYRGDEWGGGYYGSSITLET